MTTAAGEAIDINQFAIDGFRGGGCEGKTCPIAVCGGSDLTDLLSQYVRELLYTTLLQDKTNIRSKVIEVSAVGCVFH